MDRKTLVWGAAASIAVWKFSRILNLWSIFSGKQSQTSPSIMSQVPKTNNNNEISCATSLPVIDMSAFGDYKEGEFNDAQKKVAEEIGKACRQIGFFYVKNHGIDENVTSRLEQLTREFYALPLEEKHKSDMSQSGKAMRGYFNVGFEKTGGLPDQKEGFYFSRDMTNSNDPLYDEPAHGPNIYPTNPPHLKEAVDSYMCQACKLANSLLAAVCVSLHLPPSYFFERYTNDPFLFFALLFYPNRETLQTVEEHNRGKWGVGPHTDYGMLTILKQDNSGGLEVRNADNEWISAPPIPGTFVVNIGDMLEKMTGGLYRSTLHRVVTPPREIAPNGRVSFPFFFDPNFNAKITPIQLSQEDSQILEVFKTQRAGEERWDKLDLISLDGTYGDYVKQKAFQIFPENFKKNQK